jgi:pyruvate dehydrogenase E2 component (dihydrolipoamide acetyltransferase)
MATEFKIPELGENISSGDVVQLLVSPGDALAMEQPVLELETDKATIEVPSNVSGTIADIKVKQGDKVKVGQVVLTLGNGEAAAAPKTEEAPRKEEARQKEEAARKEEPSKAEPAEKRADKGARASKAEAAPRKGAEAAPSEAQPQPLGAPEDGGLSQAAVPGRKTEDVEAEEEGLPEQTLRPRGEVVDINRGARNAPQPAPAESEPSRGPAAPAAPSVRRLARELGVDIRLVSGSGPAGRISTDDVQAFVRTALSGGGAAQPGGGAVAAQPLPDFAKWGEVERKPMSNIRRKTAEHLGHAWSVIPHVTQHDRADITAVEGLRKKYAAQAEKAGGKLTMTAIALKIVAGALQRFPQFNSSIDVGRNEIVYKKSIHVGVAADTPRGLLVPVIRDVDRKGIFELSKELAQLSEKARNGKLGLEEMQGAGFTITNLGGIGGTSFTPIVNWPEVAILGISRGAHQPVWNGSALEPRLMLPLSLSYDHRVIDGADAARFLRWVAEAFEQPLVLAL